MPETYAQGDHIKCGSCGTKHKVARGEVLRLVLADLAPLKEALQANSERIARLEDELLGARRSLGIGANGLGIGLIYCLWQVTQKDAIWDVALIRTALWVTVLSGIVLELANYLFLAKRQRIAKVTQEIEALRNESRQLDQRLREANRL